MIHRKDTARRVNTLPQGQSVHWYWVVSPFFHQPFFVLGGLGVTAVAVYNLWFCKQLPEYDATQDPDSPMFEDKKDALKA